MKQAILISIGAIVLGASTLTMGYAASKSHGAGCERMMSEHMGMMRNEMPKECEEMMRSMGCRRQHP